MFRTKLKTIALGLMAAATLFTTSCNKEEPSPATETITITSPSAGQEFDLDDTVNITGKIDYSEGLHGYQIIIRKKADNSVQFEKEEHAHGTSVNFNGSWVNDLHEHNDMELEVIAILNHNGNTASKKVNFHCHH